jgi:hypothetical protein
MAMVYLQDSRQGPSTPTQCTHAQKHVRRFKNTNSLRSRVITAGIRARLQRSEGACGAALLSWRTWHLLPPYDGMLHSWLIVGFNDSKPCAAALLLSQQLSCSEQQGSSTWACLDSQLLRPPDDCLTLGLQQTEIAVIHMF